MYAVGYKTTPNYSSTEFYIYKLFSCGRGWTYKRPITAKRGPLRI